MTDLKFKSLDKPDPLNKIRSEHWPTRFKRIGPVGVVIVLVLLVLLVVVAAIWG